MFYRHYLSVIACICAFHSLAQRDGFGKRKNTLLGYPVAFYLPETRWGIGAAAYYNFRISTADTVSPPSQLQLGFAFTQNKQKVITLPFEFYWSQRNHSLTGEFSYNKFYYNYYGVGNRDADTIDEKFQSEFPRMRINYLKKIKPNFFAGVRYWFEDYRVFQTEEGGELQTGEIQGSVSEGNKSISSGPGIVLLYDSRDNIRQALSGSYLELVFHSQAKLFGNYYVWNRYRFDARKYFSFDTNRTLGVQFFGDFLSGEIPFSQLAYIGSSKRMRGYYEGRYRNNNLLLLQSEFRAAIYKRWGGVVFLNAATLGKNMNDLSLHYSHYSAGAGIRFMIDRDKKVNLRLDYAVGKNSSAWYFTVGEAF